MALKYFDRVKETSVTTGTGNILLGGAEAGGFRAFASVLNDGDQFYYTVQNVGPGEWESGIGTYVASANAIARTVIKSSSNANNVVALSAGNKDVALTAIADFYNQQAAGIETPPFVSAAELTSLGAI